MTDPLITPQQLHDILDDAIVLDATYYLPPDPARSRDDHRSLRIPGARLFEIDEIADKTSDLPHMIPSEEVFAQAMAALGIDGTRPVVVYDRSANHFSAPRVWYTLKLFGVPDARVLDGGLSAWQAAGKPVESGPPSPVPPVAQRAWSLAAGQVMTSDDVLGVLDAGSAAVIDARSSDRFAARAPEPRPGLRSGHMPGSTSLPFDELTRPDGRFAGIEELRELLPAETGAEGPIVTCGSGMTACVLALGLARLGVQSRLYDASWVEWGGKAHLPVATGDA